MKRTKNRFFGVFLGCYCPFWTVQLSILDSSTVQNGQYINNLPRFMMSLFRVNFKVVFDGVKKSCKKNLTKIFRFFTIILMVLAGGVLPHIRCLMQGVCHAC